jgi:hypothetical protein
VFDRARELVFVLTGYPSSECGWVEWPVLVVEGCWFKKNLQGVGKAFKSIPTQPVNLAFVQETK